MLDAAEATASRHWPTSLSPTVANRSPVAGSTTVVSPAVCSTHFPPMYGPRALTG
jgi:hypothetical protein